MVDAAVNDAKQIFKQCGTCSQTFGHLLNRAFGHPASDEERALTPLAGGIKSRGYQCGMLWGATLGVGAEAARRCEASKGGAIRVAIVATQRVLTSFVDRTTTPDCREITGRELDTVRGLVGLMIEIMRKGMDQSTCFVLAEDWAPEAIAAADAGLSEGQAELTRPAMSCASELVTKMGGSDQEAIMVAGFAGGLGLSGNACGALGAALWMKGLRWAKAHPGEQPGLLSRIGDKQTLKVFEQTTGSKFSCSEICGRSFASVDEHSAWVEGGGAAVSSSTLSQAPRTQGHVPADSPVGKVARGCVIIAAGWGTPTPTPTC